jgi:two-component system chemotaxis response regulator CheB
MIVKTNHVVGLNQKPPVQGVRPSVDVTMQSVAQIYGKSSIGIVLTGMGSDGTSGSGFIKSVGGRVAVQDAGTSVIYGMPRSVAEAGYADNIVP